MPGRINHKSIDLHLAFAFKKLVKHPKRRASRFLAPNELLHACAVERPVEYAFGNIRYEINERSGFRNR